MNALACAEYLELIESQPEVLTEFLGTIEDGLQEVVQSVQILKANCNEETVNSLFRGLHTIKGNCEMVFLPVFVAMTHRLEDIVGDVRAGKSEYNPVVGDFIASVCAEVEYQIRQVSSGQQISQQQYDDCLKLITVVCDADDVQRPSIAMHALHKLDGGVTTAAVPEEPLTPKEDTSDDQPLLTPEQAMAMGQIPGCWQTERGIDLFRFLAHQRDALVPQWQGRSDTELDLCLEINELLDCPVDPDQLTAAVYMHDFGMAFVPHDIIAKEAPLDAEEYQSVKCHMFLGAQLLNSIGGWDEAAQIVLQHHERFDGSGYPCQLTADNIHPGAVFIGLADTYCALSAARPGRGKKKSLMGAMSEINASAGIMFAQGYVDMFNEVVRGVIERKKEG